MDTMTLGQACVALGISRHTLRKWLARLGLQASQHGRDWRYWMLSAEDVEVVRAARAEMPGRQGGPIASSTSPERVRRIEPVQPSAGSLYSWYRWAVEHNISPTTVQHVVKARERRGKLRPASVALVDGRLDQAGQAALYARFVGHPRFTRCSRCPHAQPYPDEAAQNDHGAGS